jgi:hypothetical protein
MPLTTLSPLCSISLTQTHSEGRRREFSHFKAFSDPKVRETIPDPQAERTFLDSKLDWKNLDREPHASVFRLYQRLCHLRKEFTLLSSRRGNFAALALSNSLLALLRREKDFQVIAVIALEAPSSVSRAALQFPGAETLDLSRMKLLFTTEDPVFQSQAQKEGNPHLVSDDNGTLHFAVPGAAIFRIE